MRSLKVLFVLIGIIFFGVQNTYGQETNDTSSVEADNNSLKKIAINDLPTKVKQSVATIAGYTITDAFYSEDKKSKTYKIQITKGKISYNLIVGEKGKIISTEE